MIDQTHILVTPDFIPVIDYIGSLVLILGSFLAFFLSVAIYIIKVDDNRANRWISLYCLLTSIFLMRGYLLISGYYVTVPLITLLIDNIRYLMGPCVLFYFKTVIDPQFQLKRSDILHILPMMINILIMIHIYVLPTIDLNDYIKNWFTLSVLDQRYLVDSISRLIFFITFSIYIFYSFLLSYNSNVTFSRSSSGKSICLTWLCRLTLSLAVIILIWAVCAVMIVAGFQKKYLYFAVYFAVSFATFVCGVFALMRPEIFYRNLPVSLDNNDCVSSPPPPINDKDADFYFKQITQIMEKDHEYLNPDLNLVNLAEKMNISRNYLSRIINETSGYNFADFINSYRVGKTCQLIAAPDLKKQSILELAFEAGFNSKTTFNKAFKKFTGEVPSAYRKRVLSAGTDNKEN